ncbi:UDP-N-acetylglucosamine--N-acetylmuramyl-(pentapeptide) pyrophosphoryl-undecaprenol N-acetylglucosamine transferase [Microlunatus endophyticus]|uniref:UDP-N-acetylglucosamine--N-acetylmuramyl-(pentapeptide) pyrophosphoryl-undecaprenol N-acetylglucosamine transferase n=1 Tax=Microlunatus endophyticus TaxID=1716077 RepID=A0A917SE93_9ACTN|nr:undecaprenyldiphospho-muramoylpentapeptide beta-N-acetylglucosaminyltransferase [Microlunatus endophyticus]GGL76063.1 UDP-N-acetylglucosamine--N-acetylmuramyl-(pentapeptide) pyrophosphoryl-undecaprenol N-acetylglucosamine transferase [Microlunatus endophyticus]
MSHSVVLAGGGSAGHTSPLIATAEQLRRIESDITLTAIGTARGLETRTIPAAGLPLELIPPVPMPRRPGPDLAKLPVRLGKAVSESMAILRRAEADVLLGFGGYVSTPAYLAARRLGIPVVIHEQNALPGLANRLAARFTRHVATSFPDTPLPHANWIGLPLRESVTRLADSSPAERERLKSQARIELGLDPDTPTLLVTGGSQGAARINRSVIEARSGLLAEGIQILHQLGGNNIGEADVKVTDPQTEASYIPVGFIEQMEKAYAAADLVLCRAGASSVLEAALLGLPTLLVPYAVGNGEQSRNATAVVKAGGARLLDDSTLNGGVLLTAIPAILDDPAVLHRMSEAARGVASSDAARRLARLTLDVADGREADGPESLQESP